MFTVAKYFISCMKQFYVQKLAELFLHEYGRGDPHL